MKNLEDLLLKKIDSFADREKLGSTSLSILNCWVDIVADHTGLTKNQTISLVQERGLYSISAFLDTHFRFQKKILLQKNKKIQNMKIILEDSFNLNFQKKELQNSIIIRDFILKMVFFSYNKKYNSPNDLSEPEEISIKDLGLNMANSFEKYDVSPHFAKLRFKNRIFQIGLYGICSIQKLFKKRKKNIGFFINEDNNRLDRNLFYIPSLNLIKFEYPKLETKKIENKTYKNFFKKYRKLFFSSFKKLDDFKNLSLKIKQNLSDTVLFLLIIQSEICIFNISLLNSHLNNLQRQISEKKIDGFLIQGGAFRNKNVLLRIALNRSKKMLIEYRVGGGAIGGLYCAEPVRDRIKTNFLYENTDVSLSWWDGNSDNLNKEIIRSPNLIYSKFKEYKKRNNTHPLKILYSPISLSGFLYSVEAGFQFNPFDMEQHRMWTTKLFKHLDKNLKNDIEILIKIKNNNSILFKGHEFQLFPKYNLNNIKTYFLSKYPSWVYLDLVDLHIFCGPSTTFSESMAKNIPSICMWNKKAFCEYRNHKNIINKLHAAGIIVYTEEEFLTSIKKFLLSDDWFGDNIQLLRDEFCNKFAYYDKNWRNILDNIFMKL